MFLVQRPSPHARSSSMTLALLP